MNLLIMLMPRACKQSVIVKICIYEFLAKVFNTNDYNV
jgi:hypothetical protein